MAIWKIWLEPDIKTVEEEHRQNPGQLPPRYRPTYLRYNEFVQALSYAQQRVQRFCNWGFEAVQSGYHFRIYSRNPSTLASMYEPSDGSHSVGIHYLNSNQIFIHDGWVPQGTHPHGPFGFYWAITGGTITSLASLLLHELGHDESLLGTSHRLDLGKLIQSSPPQAEIDLVRRRFGPPVIPAPKLTSISLSHQNLLATWDYRLEHGPAKVTMFKDGAVVRTIPHQPSGNATSHFNLIYGNNDLVIEAESETGRDTLSRPLHVPDSRPRANWQNPNNKYDVTGDGHVTPIDALRIINYLNRSGPGRVPPLPAEPTTSGGYFDVNGDGSITPSDALAVINQLNRGGFSFSTGRSLTPTELYELLAQMSP